MVEAGGRITVALFTMGILRKMGLTKHSTHHITGFFWQVQDNDGSYSIDANEGVGGVGGRGKDEVCSMKEERAKM